MIDDNEMKSIMTGDIFHKYNVTNFCSDDFFRWTSDINTNDEIKPVLRAIAHQLSRFDFKSVHEDILKGVYQELVDEDTRHGLGEFYTPDWLCSHVVEALDITPGKLVLDPACGSGSFLKAVANRMCELKKDITAGELNESIYGIDIHPLSVQIAKATLLTALGDKIQAEKRPLSLHIFLANTLQQPHEDVTMSLFGPAYQIRVAETSLSVDKSIFDNEARYDELIYYCQGAAVSDSKVGCIRDKSQMDFTFSRRFQTQDASFLDGAYNIYKALSEAKLAGRDSIWLYVMQNCYRPFFLQKKFDFVVGNPPWLTFADVENGQYQNELISLANKYNMKPSPTNMPHMEIAALFLAHSCNYFLKPSGRIGFVMPRSFLSAAQHHATRMAKTKHVKITDIWDLRDVEPLFKVPCCVLFSSYQDVGGATAEKIIKGVILNGKLERHNIDRYSSNRCINITTGNFFLSNLGDATAWIFGKKISFGGNNVYKDGFRQGATIVPRSFYFVDIDQKYTGDMRDRIIRVKTSSAAIKDAKKPWDSIVISDYMNTKFMYNTVLANNLVPFSTNGIRLIVLPGQVQGHGFFLFSMSDLEGKGEIEAVKWFSKVSDEWEAKRTERNKDTDFIQYLNFMNKLSSQNFNANYVVLYASSGINICSSVIERDRHCCFPFVCDHKTYCYFLNQENEAYYLTSFLNSNYANELIKPFQSQGLQGARDIHKKILDVPFPRFDEDNDQHILLSNIAQQASVISQRYVAKLNLGEDGGALGPRELGKLRGEIRKHLSAEIAQIDTILEKIILNK